MIDRFLIDVVAWFVVAYSADSAGIYRSVWTVTHTALSGPPRVIDELKRTNQREIVTVIFADREATNGYDVGAEAITT
jgi:hypothetical protein